MKQIQIPDFDLIVNWRVPYIGGIINYLKILDNTANKNYIGLVPRNSF